MVRLQEEINCNVNFKGVTQRKGGTVRRISVLRVFRYRRHRPFDLLYTNNPDPLFYPKETIGYNSHVFMVKHERNKILSLHVIHVLDLSVLYLCFYQSNHYESSLFVFSRVFTISDLRIGNLVGVHLKVNDTRVVVFNISFTPLLDGTQFL